MTDRELLEAAAKAAKYDFIEKRFPLFPSAYEFYLRSRHPARTSDYPTLWNPLTDDGDALRLAVKLKMMVDIGGGGFCTADINELDASVNECITPDPYAATRRAIVRAAAEIGNGMAPKAPTDDLPEDNYYKTQAEAEELGRSMK
jgi:hypothetical protein